MDLALGIILILGSTAAMLSAFGGDTWNKGDDPLYKRINGRGWFSLACTVIVVIAGIWLKTRIAHEAAEKSKQLAYAQSTLTALKGELAQAQRNLSKQETLNLIALFSTGHPVTAVHIVVGLPPGAGSAGDRIELVFPMLQHSLMSLVHVLSEVHPFSGLYSASRWTYTQRGVVRLAAGDTSGEGAEPQLFTLPTCVPPYFPFGVRPSAYTCATTPQQFMIDIGDFAGGRRGEPITSGSSAAVALWQLDHMPDPHDAVDFILTLRKDFATRSARVEFVRKHPELKIARRQNPIVIGNKKIGQYSVRFDIPNNVVENVRHYWERDGSKSAIYFWLDKSHTLQIWSRLKPKVTNSGDEIVIRLRPTTKPKIRLGFTELGYP